jgi:hypothetical protein
MDLSGSWCTEAPQSRVETRAGWGLVPQAPYPPSGGGALPRRLPPDPSQPTHNCPCWEQQLGSEGTLLRQVHREQSSAAAEFLWERWPQATAWRTMVVNEPAATSASL